MAADVAFDYAAVRVVPHVERGEFVNVGVILSAPSRRFLECALRFDPARLLALAAEADVAAVARHLEALRAVCAGDPAAGPVAALSQRQRFHWLVAPRSTVIQVSPVHTGLCDDPAVALARLLDALVPDARCQT
jgi:hypothetical protein